MAARHISRDSKRMHGSKQSTVLHARDVPLGTLMDETNICLWSRLLSCRIQLSIHQTTVFERCISEYLIALYLRLCFFQCNIFRRGHIFSLILIQDNSSGWMGKHSIQIFKNMNLMMSSSQSLCFMILPSDQSLPPVGFSPRKL